jgi:hypothetical protein
VRAASETPAIVRFESIDDGEQFRADVQFDSDGLVIDYPRLATRMPGPERHAAQVSQRRP